MISNTKKRQDIKNNTWPKDIAWNWTEYKESGWFAVPRTLPLIVQIIDSPKISGKVKPSNVYLELLSRNLGDGIVELTSEQEHAYNSGHTKKRAVRTWKEKMQLLVNHEFIKTKRLGIQEYKYAIIIHPTVVIHSLYEKQLIDPTLWEIFQSRQADVKAIPFQDLEKNREEQFQTKTKRRRRFGEEYKHTREVFK